MINFPGSPVVGDTYTYNTRTWVWNGSGWERQVNAGQGVAVFINPGIEVYAIAAAAAFIDNAWQQINYV